MTFEEYLKDYFRQTDASTLNFIRVSRIIELADEWHTQELKSMRSKGANTTNTKYSKEQRSEWAKRGTKARLQRKLNK